MFRAIKQIKRQNNKKKLASFNVWSIAIQSRNAIFNIWMYQHKHDFALPICVHIYSVACRRSAPIQKYVCGPVLPPILTGPWLKAKACLTSKSE